MGVKPRIPPAKRGGRPRDVNLREVVNAIFYVLSTGCQWAALPKDLPPKSAAHSYFMLWERHAGAPPPRALYRDARARRARGKSDGRDHRQPDRQGRSKRGSALDPQGFDAGKKIRGRKPHILVDALGLLLSVVVYPADVQDRDGVVAVLRRARWLFPFIELIWRRRLSGPKVQAAVAATGAWRIEIVKRTNLHRLVVRPNRRIVERTFAWISRNRRLARDFERYSRSVAAFFRLAMIRLMLRRLTQPNHSS